MKEIYYNAGIRIRDLREQNHYTREKLSEMADISPKFLYEIESGQKGFSADTLYRLAQALGTNADYILYGKYEKNTSEEMLRPAVRNKFFQTLIKTACILYVDNFPHFTRISKSYPHPYDAVSFLKFKL